MSGTTIAAAQLGIEYNAMAIDQQQDAEVQDHPQSASSFQVEDFLFGSDSVTLLCDISSGWARPMVPASLRRQVLI